MVAGRGGGRAGKSGVDASPRMARAAAISPARGGGPVALQAHTRHVYAPCEACTQQARQIPALARLLLSSPLSSAVVCRTAMLSSFTPRAWLSLSLLRRCSLRGFSQRTDALRLRGRMVDVDVWFVGGARQGEQLLNGEQNPEAAQKAPLPTPAQTDIVGSTNCNMLSGPPSHGLTVRLPQRRPRPPRTTPHLHPGALV